jgi:hypothetical protein
MYLSPIRSDVSQSPRQHLRIGTIVVATDLTDAEYMLPQAIVQASAAGSRVTLVHAFPHSSDPSHDDPANPSLTNLKSFRDARMTLLGLARQIEAASIQCDTVTVRGNPVEVIMSEIARVGAIGLVLGSHGSGVGGHVEGSIPHQLFAALDVPIFLVGLRAPESQHIA